MADTTKLHRYDGDHATVTWDARRCIHAAECVHRLPAVFDAKAKPWVEPGATAADALAATVYHCPTGALKLERRDGAAEPVSAANTATVTRNGPNYLRGDLALIGEDGGVVLTDTRMAFCRCGASEHKPLCDGAHKRIGFGDDGALQAGEAPPGTNSGGRLAIRARPDGPLMCTGALTVIGTNGRSASAATTFLCRCGGSQNKPYCDGTHKKIGFFG
jgi:CDGSH-type Zn-finger protein/uncharacterized Fe-S cluster protein YjdI